MCIYKMNMWMGAPAKAYPKNFICCNKISTNISLCFNILYNNNFCMSRQLFAVKHVSIKINVRKCGYQMDFMWQLIMWHKKLHENKNEFQWIEIEFITKLTINLLFERITMLILKSIRAYDPIKIQNDILYLLYA